MGRFISEDPIGFVAGDANLYRYGGNGPVNSVDPFGLFQDDAFIEDDLKRQRRMNFNFQFPIGDPELVFGSSTADFTDELRIGREFDVGLGTIEFSIADPASLTRDRINTAFMESIAGNIDNDFRPLDAITDVALDTVKDLIDFDVDINIDDEYKTELIFGAGLISAGTVALYHSLLKDVVDIDFDIPDATLPYTRFGKFEIGANLGESDGIYNVSPIIKLKLPDGQSHIGVRIDTFVDPDDPTFRVDTPRIEVDPRW